jgi:hypothetical protein
MWIAWGIFGFVQIVTARYLTCYWRAHMWIHAITGTIVTLMTIASSILAFS